MTDREIMQAVLEAMEHLHRTGDTQVFDMCYAPELIPALKHRLAQPEQESFSPEAIRATQAAWKMGYDAAKAEQPEQEPVAWEDVLGAIARGWTHDDNKHKTMDVQLAVAIAKEIQDMVIAPPQRKPLTKEEMFEAIRPLYYSEKDARGAVDISEDEYRAIEAAHGIKENT